RARIGPIALLHLDCDWHASVRCCLDHLYDQVVDGGFVVLDDYYGYDGCAIAVHEFLGERHLAHRIESVVGHWGVCEHYVDGRFRKGEANWQWEYRLRLAREDRATVIPPGQKVIVVDDGALDGELLAGRSATPFLERNGRYWGRPPDSATAVREVERARQAGGGFMVFTWPAVWWLRSYPRAGRALTGGFPRLPQD